MRRRRLLAAGMALPLLPSVTALADRKTATWQSAAPLPLKTQELYPAVFERRLYVAGGIAARMGVPYFTSTCISYDADTDRWRTEPDLPEDRHHAALASQGGQLLMIGGFNGGYTHVWRMRDTVHRLTETGWAPLETLPKPQAEGVLATSADDRLHLVTGQSPKGAANKERSDHVEIRDHWVRAGSAWESLAPIPTPRNSATGGWLGDQLIVTGGRTAEGNLDTTEIYDAKEDRWRTAAPMPLPQAGTASVVVGEDLIVFGGEIFVPEADVFANVWRYASARDTWAPLPDLPTPRHGLGAGLIDGKAYVVGGATQPGGRGTSDLNEVLTV